MLYFCLVTKFHKLQLSKEFKNTNDSIQAHTQSSASRNLSAALPCKFSAMCFYASQRQALSDAVMQISEDIKVRLSIVRC